MSFQAQCARLLPALHRPALQHTQDSSDAVLKWYWPAEPSLWSSSTRPQLKESETEPPPSPRRRLRKNCPNRCGNTPEGSAETQTERGVNSASNTNTGNQGKIYLLCYWCSFSQFQHCSRSKERELSHFPAGWRTERSSGGLAGRLYMPHRRDIH